MDLRWVQGKLRERRRRQDAWQAQVRANNIHSANRRASLSDAELIATAPGIPNVSHQMEMERRLKNSIEELTTETKAARRSADRTAIVLIVLTVVIAVLTAALVALAV